jgi:hypothetical protein
VVKNSTVRNSEKPEYKTVNNQQRYNDQQDHILRK